ncbi:hypothetical protein AB0O01_00430 [Streptomyces sp. NPDC093252]|uniref:hypothetical protein n=1 Tax=Streptomyces sp. NPDC093252 TaxID=3154980 RepID=UPI0034340421
MPLLGFRFGVPQPVPACLGRQHALWLACAGLGRRVDADEAVQALAPVRCRGRCGLCVEWAPLAWKIGQLCCRTGAGGSPTAGFLIGLGGVAGAAQELVEGVGDVGLVLVAVSALFDLGLDVTPDGFIEGLVDVVAMDPRDLVELAVGECWFSLRCPANFSLRCPMFL